MARNSTCLSIVLVCAISLQLPATGFGEMKHGGAPGHDKAPMVRHGHLTTFGPGEAPHFHALDLSSFKEVKDIARPPDEVPPPTGRKTPEIVKVALTVKEVVSEIAPGITNHYWTFGGKVPGPFIRVRQFDTVEVSIVNDGSNSHNHSIDLHAVNGPGGGAAYSQVKPGETKAFSFKATHPGLYVYHCGTPNVPMHIAHGLYGLILVEPEAGLTEVDREFYVMQGELYTKGAIGETGFQEFDAAKMLGERPEYILFNGRVKALADHSLKAEAGETVRIFIGNAGVSAVSSFHVIGEIFDRVYHEAAAAAAENVQTTLVPAGGAAIVEFTVDVPGSYVLVDHALTRIDRGAWGLLEVSGSDQPDIIAPIE